MTSSRYLLSALLLAFSPALIAGLVVLIDGTPCSGLCRVFIDDFNDGNITGWSEADTNGTDGQCSIRAGTADSINAESTVCNYDGVGNGFQGPNLGVRNQWGAVTARDADDINVGPALRRETGGDGNMDDTQFYFASRISTSTMDIRICDGEDSNGDEAECGTIYQLTGQTYNAGDSAILAVAAETGSTEIAGWYVDADTETWNPCDPGTWEPAEVCLSSDGTISESVFTATVLPGSLAICDCGGATSCVTWTFAPDASIGGVTRDYPASGQFNVGYYVGSSTARDATTVCGGTL